jgi:hypothetical protein
LKHLVFKKELGQTPAPWDKRGRWRASWPWNVLETSGNGTAIVLPQRCVLRQRGKIHYDCGVKLNLSRILAMKNQLTLTSIA